jgi:hypothetical protein
LYNPCFFIAKIISEKDEQETKVTTSLKTTIPSLRKYTNYSISVLAFTSIGDGVGSPPVICCTEEDGMYHQYMYVVCRNPYSSVMQPVTK